MVKSENILFRESSVEKIKKVNYIKLLKYVAGSVVSILLAGILRLKFAYAAGIITLLTIQDTKKETVKITIKRLVVFAVMSLLSAGIFSLAGYTLTAFGAVLIPYLFFCLLLDMKEAIAPIAVLCTHYISVESCGMEMILNELLLLLTGAGTGVVLNLFMPDGEKRIRKYQQTVDDKIIRILERMAVYLEREDKSDYDSGCFEILENMLSDLKRESVNYMNNHFLGENDYYYNYMQMRLRQCNLLKHIYGDIVRMGMVPKQVRPLADFLREMSMEFHEDNDGTGLLSRLEGLEEYYKEEELPKTRGEFESRAILYHILKDLEMFVEIKHDFAMLNN